MPSVFVFSLRQDHKQMRFEGLCALKNYQIMSYLFWIPVICNLYLAFNKALLQFNYSVSILFHFLDISKYWTWGRLTESLQPTFESSPHARDGILPSPLVPLRTRPPEVRASNPSPKQHAFSLGPTSFVSKSSVFAFVALVQDLGWGSGVAGGCAGLKGGKPTLLALPLRTHGKQTALAGPTVTIYSFLSTAAKILHQVVSFWLLFLFSKQK